MSSKSLSAQRPVSEAFALYGRYPLLFFALAAGVIVPYLVVVLLITGTGPLTQSSLSFGTMTLLTTIEWLVIGPLVSALQVHAVADTKEGREPKLSSVVFRGLRVLPVVVAASIISALGIVAGFFALIVPGIILVLRWAVVAQTAAIEDEGWLPALRRSAELSDGNYGKIALFLIYLALIVTVPILPIGLALRHSTTTAASFVIGVAIRVLTSSFTALATAHLYFELRTISERRPVAGGSWSLAEDAVPETEHSLDPRNYTDENRAKGWYVDPASPARMRYWQDGEGGGWTGKARTPKKIRDAWRAESDDGPSEPS